MLVAPIARSNTLSVKLPPGRRSPLRSGLVLLLVVAAFFAALPWLSCVWGAPTALFDPFRIGICTSGLAFFPNRGGIPGFSGPFYGSLIVGLIFLTAAVFAAVTRRPL